MLAAMQVFLERNDLGARPLRPVTRSWANSAAERPPADTSLLGIAGVPDETKPEDSASGRTRPARTMPGERTAGHAAPAEEGGDTRPEAEALREGSGRSPVVIAVSAMLLAIHVWARPPICGVTRSLPIDAPTAPTAAAELTFTDAQRGSEGQGVRRVPGRRAWWPPQRAGRPRRVTRWARWPSPPRARLALLGGGQYMLDRRPGYRPRARRGGAGLRQRADGCRGRRQRPDSERRPRTSDASKMPTSRTPNRRMCVPA